jgi:hypothetical protein
MLKSVHIVYILVSLVGAATKIIKELAVVLIALVITGVLIAQAKHRIDAAEDLYGPYNVQLRNETSSQTSFLGLRESLHSLKDYLNYSIAIFKNEKGKEIEEKTGNGIYRFYMPSPREKFMRMNGTTPQHAILLTFTILSLSMVLIFLAGLYWVSMQGTKGGGATGYCPRWPPSSPESPAGSGQSF